METRLLITGFAPFPGVVDNPTQSLVSALSTSDDAILAGARRVILPTQYHVAPRQLAAVMEPVPSAVLMTGLSTMARCLTLEARATNQCAQDRPDAAGHCPPDRLLPMGVIETRLDLASVAKKLITRGLNAAISQDAGGYVCNHLYYAALSGPCAAPSAPPALFVHIPAISGTPLAESAAGAMAIEEMIAGLGIVARALLAMPR